MKFVKIYLFLLLSLNVVSQSGTTFRINDYGKLIKKSTVNIENIEDKYLPALISTEAPNVDGDIEKKKLKEIKAAIDVQFPKDFSINTQPRSAVNPPTILGGFEVGGVQPGIPVDHHLAMGDKYIVTAGNSYISMNKNTGGQFKALSLTAFTQAADVTGSPFDPRLIYDYENKRYILFLLAGFNSNQTDIVVAFSKTEDPRGSWNIYSIEGNPNNKAEWTDYPMVSMTKDHVYITINLLKDGESWQEGFVETLIWELDKMAGYDGNDISSSFIDGIQLDGRNIRNLCPMEASTNEVYDDMYFVSNRNFDVSNDTFFVVHYDPMATDPADKLTIRAVRSDNPYGAPPDAEQAVGRLATNDARVLEGFRIGNYIQFVGNTRNPDNNLAAIYHGEIMNADTDTSIKLNHISGVGYEIGYPGITYVGEDPLDRDAIINVNHTAKDRFPGISALYSIPGVGYSDIVEVGKGRNYVNLISGDVQRWGDYSGSQQDFDNPGEVWVAGFGGAQNRGNMPLVGWLSKPSEPTSSNETDFTNNVNVFPNPANNRISVDITIPNTSGELYINLYNTNGALVDKLYKAQKYKQGRNQFSFDVSYLESGLYILRLIDSEQEVIGSYPVNIVK